MADEIIVYHVGMPSVTTSTKHYCNTVKGMNLAELLQLCLPGLTGNGGIEWSEVVQNIDFSHSSRVAWSTLNNLIGTSRQSPRQCSVSANATANQLVKTGNTRMQIERFFSPLCRNCLTFGELHLLMQ